MSGASNTTIIGGQMPKITIDSGGCSSCYTNIFANGASAITDNSDSTHGCTNIIGPTGHIGGTCNRVFDGAVSTGTGGIWMSTGGGNGIRFGGAQALWNTGTEMILDNGSGSIGDWKIQTPLKWGTIYSAAGTAVPAASGISDGRLCVSDSTACTSGTTYTSGGSTACELWSNGTNWIESGSGC
jgi:hypothetical protein